MSTHPARNDLYTPITPEFLELLERMRAETGNWRLLAAAVPMRMKVLRNIRGKGKRKAVSQTMVDRLCTTTGVGSINEFEWFTADDLVALGIWKEPVPITDQTLPTVEEKARRRRERRRVRKKRKRRDDRRKLWGLPPLE